MQLLLKVLALVGVCSQTIVNNAPAGSSNTTFSLTVAGNVANVVATFSDTIPLNTSWIGFAFSTGDMISGGLGSDIFLCEQDGGVGRFWVTAKSLNVGSRRNVTGGTCTMSSVGGVNNKTITFSRFMNASANNERTVYAPATTTIILARGPYPLAQHGDDWVKIPINIPAPGSSPTAPPTAAPAATVQAVIPGYPKGALAAGGNVKIGWEVGNETVRFAVEVTGFSYVSLGFQSTVLPKMTGDAVVVQSSGLAYYTVTDSQTPVAALGTYFTNGVVNTTGGVLRGEFVRNISAPVAGAVAFTDLTNVIAMVAYGNNFPQQHIGRAQVTLDLMRGGAQDADERSPAAAPKITAIVLLGICAFVGFIFTYGLSHTAPGRWLFFRRVCQDSQFLGPRTPACFDITWGQAILLFLYFALITLFSRLEFGHETSAKFLRAMGWTSTLSIACASIPVSRHSVLLYFFGMSFERAILIHRILGRTAILIVLMHFVAVLLDSRFQPLRLTDPLIPPYMIDLSLGFWAFVLLLVMFVTSLPLIRRKFFELFYYTHHLFIVVWILAILHNKTVVHQLTLIVPFALWGVDRLIRFYRGRIRQRELVSATIIADALRLEFKGEIASLSSTESGSYAFLNVPAVSWFQWHPFSISSRAGSPNFTFHIKNMGPGTFTGALHEHFTANKTGVKVNVDGPYGRSAVRFEEYESILLFAGGVGVTPMAAILDDLYEKCKGANKPPKLEHVTFCWSVQSKETVGWMEELLKKIQDNPSPAKGVTFDIQVFVTRSKEESPLFKAGRPKIPAVFETAARPKDGAGKEWRVGVLACGPESMVVECQKQAMTVGYDFHKEIFAF